MTQLLIIFINLLVLCISGHIWKGITAVYYSKGFRACVPYSFGSILLVGSGAALANTFLFQIAEIAQAAP